MKFRLYKEFRFLQQQGYDYRLAEGFKLNLGLYLIPTKDGKDVPNLGVFVSGDFPSWIESSMHGIPVRKELREMLLLELFMWERKYTFESVKPTGKEAEESPMAMFSQAVWDEFTLWRKDTI